MLNLVQHLVLSFGGDPETTLIFIRAWFRQV